MDWLWRVLMALGLVPLAWLALLRWRGSRLDSAWWWMAFGFAVSFVADVATLVYPHRLVSQVYPVLQAALFILVLLPRKYAEWVIAVILVAASVSIAARDAAGLDVLLRVVAFGSVAGVAWLTLKPSVLRSSLIVAFGGGAVAWVGYVLSPGWTSYAGIQVARVAGTALWCLAATRSET